jgi:hypothetical protein
MAVEQREEIAGQGRGATEGYTTQTRFYGYAYFTGAEKQNYLAAIFIQERLILA